MESLFYLILHTDDALLEMAANNVNQAYLIFFLIIFLETGLLFFPFLPGDGLLFSAGVVAASTNMRIEILLPFLVFAAITGNIVNYSLGKIFGRTLLKSKNYFLKSISEKYEPKTRQFYKKYGGMAILIGRFFPIVRTYIPFFAGAIRMRHQIFIWYTIIGALLWVLLFTLTGYLVGEIEWVKNNYGLIFVVLIIPIILPVVFVALKRLFIKIFRS